MIQHQLKPRNLAAALQDEIDRRKETIAALKAGGHVTADAERDMERLEDTVSMLRP
jgi:hypothetical protein